MRDNRFAKVLCMIATTLFVFGLTIFSSVNVYAAEENGLMLKDGRWAYVENGNVVTDFTGLVQNEVGWWYVMDGYVNFNAIGLFQNEYGWWYVENGGVNFNYTGLARNLIGWWYVENGGVNFNYTGLVPNEYGWWYVQNGGIDFSYIGLVPNEVGWWYVNYGGIDFGHNGIVANEFGRWVVVNGMVDFSQNADEVAPVAPTSWYSSHIEELNKLYHRTGDNCGAYYVYTTDVPLYGPKYQSKVQDYVIDAGHDPLSIKRTNKFIGEFDEGRVVLLTYDCTRCLSR